MFSCFVLMDAPKCHCFFLFFLYIYMRFFYYVFKLYFCWVSITYICIMHFIQVLIHSSILELCIWCQRHHQIPSFFGTMYIEVWLIHTVNLSQYCTASLYLSDDISLEGRPQYVHLMVVGTLHWEHCIHLYVHLL